MTRRIFCEVCGRPKGLHPDGFTVNGVFHPLSELVCETCDQPLKAGDKAIGWTMWREAIETSPGAWEQEYGKTQP